MNTDLKGILQKKLDETVKAIEETKVDELSIKDMIYFKSYLEGELSKLNNSVPLHTQ